MQSRFYLGIGLGALLSAAFCLSANYFVPDESVLEEVSQALLRVSDDPGICQGRLTLTSATPITTANVTGATTIYFTPYLGNSVSLYTGSQWKLYPFSELSLSLGTLSNATNYDVFLYDNAGTLTMELTAWAGNNARATALTMQNGVQVRSGATTRRYLGTLRTTSTTTTEDSDTKRFLWNYNHRVQRRLVNTEGTNSWTYSANTTRSVNGNAAMMVEIVIGLGEVPIETESRQYVGNTVNLYISTQTCEDCTNSYTYSGGGRGLTAYNTGTMQVPSRLVRYPTLGYHYYGWNENGSGSGTQTWWGATSQSYIAGWVEG